MKSLNMPASPPFPLRDHAGTGLGIVILDTGPVNGPGHRIVPTDRQVVAKRCTSMQRAENGNLSKKSWKQPPRGAFYYDR
jgi:hypothetical protein